jgi:hypothetical protein
MNQTSQMIVAAGRIRRVVDELREHGAGRSEWMRDQLAAVRHLIANTPTLHWSLPMLHSAGDAVQNIFEATTCLRRPFAAIEYLEAAERDIERLTGQIATGSCECCGGTR